jgi:hypothetical protein
LKEQLGIRSEELEILKKRLGDTERKYQEAILDVQRSMEERQALEDAVGRLKREWEGARTARDAAYAQLATKQMQLVDAREQLRMSEERWIRERRMEKQRIEEAVRVEARAREHEISADAQRRLEEETTRRIAVQRLVEEARREGRREGRRERKGSHVTFVVKEKPRSSMAWSLITGRTP